MLEFLISFAVITGLFAMIIKTLPDAQVMARCLGGGGAA